jgi:hypothetical protein
VTTHRGHVAGQAAFNFTSDRWKDQAWYGLRELVRSGQDFTTDSILPFLDGIDGERRALGSIMREAQRLGWVVPLGYVTSERRESHMRPKRQWRPVPENLFS